jgi:hypothetical protein
MGEPQNRSERGDEKFHSLKGIEVRLSNLQPVTLLRCPGELQNIRCESGRDIEMTKNNKMKGQEMKLNEVFLVNANTTDHAVQRGYCLL